MTLRPKLSWHHRRMTEERTGREGARVRSIGVIPGLHAALLSFVAACGVRSGLEVPTVRERDAATVMDAGRRDAGETGPVDAFTPDVGACEVEPEVCNDRDDDCDGVIDEAVRSACDDCRPGCRIVDVPRDFSWNTASAQGVDFSPDGSLALSMTRTESSSGWIANYRFGTVTRLDLRTGAQLGEYDSVLADGSNHASPPGEECETERRGGNCPSRTAVDLRGAVYVANRAFFAQGTVTKIAGEEADCIDRNANGVIETSRDVNANGRIDRDVPGEFLGQRDECVLYTRDVGNVSGVPRAIAFDSEGRLWVGLHGERRAAEVDPFSGLTRRTVSLGRLQPYGAAGDREGRVWFVEVGTGRIVAIDGATGALVREHTFFSDRDCSGSYGVAVDRDGRVWVAGFTCPVAFVYDPASDSSMSIPLPDGGATRGVAADASGRVYVTASHEYIRINPNGTLNLGPSTSRLSIIDGRTNTLVRTLGLTTPLPGVGTTGVGLDPAGTIWLVNQDSSTATRIDPTTFEARDFATGIAPYTYSDFTGYALRTFTSASGTVRSVTEGCGAGITEWERATIRADIPTGAHVELRVRSSPRADTLADQTWLGPFEGPVVDLANVVPRGRFLEVEATLRPNAAQESPRLASVVLQLNCL